MTRLTYRELESQYEEAQETIDTLRSELEEARVETNRQRNLRDIEEYDARKRHNDQAAHITRLEAQRDEVLGVCGHGQLRSQYGLAEEVCTILTREDG